MTTQSAYPSIGSISAGTLQLEDLIPAFLGTLAELTPDDPGIAQRIEAIKSRINVGIFEPADFTWLEEQLFNAAPPYCFFGPLTDQEDDSNYGFWPDLEALEPAIYDGDMIRVDDVADVAHDFNDYVIHVDDHGKTTLYSAKNGELTEVWAVV